MLLLHPNQYNNLIGCFHLSTVGEPTIACGEQNLDCGDRSYIQFLPYRNLWLLL